MPAPVAKAPAAPSTQSSASTATQTETATTTVVVVDEEPEEELEQESEVVSDGEPTEYDDHTVKELREELRRRDLPVSGTKQELIERLVESSPVD